MTSRERLMAFAVGTLVVVGGGGFAFDKLFLSPRRERKGRVEQLGNEVEKKKDKQRKIEAILPGLGRWKQLSLPSDVELARREYQTFLEKLTRDSDIDNR